MKIENLHEGQRVANYRKLCELLEEPIKGGGNAKKYQLKEFERYFSFHKDGNAFIVDEVFSEAKAKTDGRNRYLPLVEPILMNFLANLPTESLYQPWKNWFLDLGMVGETFYDNEQREEEVEFWRSNSYTMHRLAMLAHNKMREILSTAVANMAKRNLISYQETWCLVHKYGPDRLAYDIEIEFIESLHNEVIQEMGYTSLSQIYFSPARSKEFSQKVHERLLKKTMYRNAFKVVEIKPIGAFAERYAEIDVDPLRKQLNREICSAVESYAKHLSEAELDKAMEVFMAEDFEKGLEEEKKKFRLPDHFSWDCSYLIDRLMKY